MVTNIEGSVVRMKGLEPPRLSAPDPKSGTATNYATSACDFDPNLQFHRSRVMAPDPKSAPTCRGTNYVTSAKGGANLWNIHK